MPEFKTIDEYRVLTAITAVGLADKVNDLIKHGWQPYRDGYSINGNQPRYCQPMAKGAW